MELIGEYKNGNYQVAIFNDGTKVRKTKANEFIPEFPESIDLKITNYCDMNCPMCHEKSSEKGERGDLDAAFIDTLHPYTELALGGGNPLSHSGLEDFLVKLKEKRIIANITVNQEHFMKNLVKLNDLCEKELIHGLGISLRDPNEKFICFTQYRNNIVLHVINGIFTEKQYEEIKGKDYKLLILGYKDFGRGTNYKIKESRKIIENQKWLYGALPDMIKNHDFKVISFDNLAIKQLDVQALMPDNDWDEFYMGDDGKFTMYIDLVERKYAATSISMQRHVLETDIKSMFDTIRKENG
jgi:hypothetical protein